MKSWIITFIFLAHASVASAGKLELKKDQASIFIQEVTGWELVRDLFGMPFVYFSPLQSGQRSNISFTDTGARLALEIKALAQNQRDYQHGRREWSRQIGATTVSFYPYEVRINSRGHRVHQIGHSYEHEAKVYSEKSYYIECRGKIVFAKSLRLRSNDDHEKDFHTLIDSLDCGGI
jgi:hypothetical protein